MVVKKRSGREEAFNLDKIKNTLAAASDELGRPLNSSDLEYVANQTGRRIGQTGRDRIGSDEIFHTLLAVLEQEGYPHLAKAYRENASNHQA